MKKSLLICLFIIISITAVACGKKQEAVIIEAQDSGKDTTTGEIVKGDSAGIVDVNEDSDKKSNTQVAQTDGWVADTTKEIIILGEWECSNGSKMILDNGYNLVYSDDKDKDLIGSYTFTFNNPSLVLKIWNRPMKVETPQYDADGNEIEPIMVEKVGMDTIKYEILAYEHNSDYTEAKLSLKDADGNEITATLVKPIAEDSSVTQSYVKYQEYLNKQEDERLKDKAEEMGMTLEEYKEYKMQKQLEAEEKENNSTE